ncbi:MAG: TrkA C-terminal domain-containing protein [Planctomycetota bacterium]|nr:TrkA C-terminal domain-containing protein [Planctomycetota bacterium]
MSGALFAIIIVAFAAFFVIRVGATALEMTGVSREAARFQALSAFFGAGFTTRESEMVVNHPVRRRVVRDLIIIGNIGVVTLLGSVVITFMGVDPKDPRSVFEKAAVLAVGLGALMLLSRSRIMSRAIDAFIRRSLERTELVHAMDYEAILRVRSGYTIADFTVEHGDWIDGLTLGEAKLRNEGINVLGVARGDGAYEGVPRGPTKISAGDTMILYAHEPVLRRFASRRKGPRGEQDHRDAERKASESGS